MIKNNISTENGFHQDFFKDGSVSSEGHISGGKKTGEWKYYYLKTRSIKAIGKFENGKMAGEWRWNHENGVLSQVGSFDDNEKQTGTWSRYKKDGSVLEKIEFVAGKKVKRNK